MAARALVLEEWAYLGLAGTAQAREEEGLVLQPSLGTQCHSRILDTECERRWPMAPFLYCEKHSPSPLRRLGRSFRRVPVSGTSGSGSSGSLVGSLSR